MFDDVGDDDEEDEEDEVVLPLFSRFIPSCVHSEATYCIDSFTEDWHSDATHLIRILIQNSQKKMETHSVRFSTTMCYLSISSILFATRKHRTQLFQLDTCPMSKASNQSPLPRGRTVENFNTMRHDELGTESGRSFGTPRSVNLQDLMFQSCPFSTGPWQNSHYPCLQFGFPPYGCS